jgi:uncharacterized heparinase superfamily protein
MPGKYRFSVNRHKGELVAAAFAGMGASAADAFHASGFWQRRLNGPAPDRLLVNPRSFYPKSPAEAELMLLGRYRLAGGEAITRDGSPFFVTPPSELWAESLHGFHWLRHFDAGGSEPFQEHLRQLIAHWVRNYGKWHPVAWRPHVIGRRLMTWSSFGRLVLANAEVLFRSRVLLSMARQARHLSRTAGAAPPGMPRFTAAVGLVQSGVCLPDGDARMAKGLHMLAEELSMQILPDGGHVSRNPECILEAASDLLSLVDAMTQRELVVPVTIRRALDRMMPMIRFMRHGDGRLAVFNGSSEGLDGWAETILLHDHGKPRSLTQSPQSGYQRISCGDTHVLVDAGTPPPAPYATHAHAGTLSFELSAGQERLIVNCGTSVTKGDQWQDAMRATAAHSTLTIADESSAHVVPSGWAQNLLGPRLVDGPRTVECKRRESEDGVFLEMAHDGYVASFQLRHERRLYVSHDGTDIRGEERVVPAGAQQPAARECAVRFHLHPSVRVMKAGRGVVLTLPGGATWRFSSDADLSVTESVYLGHANQIRKTQQVVVSMLAGPEAGCVKWALKRATASDAD